ncbi:MAG: DUF115 domain-containing protein [bacterium]|nr:DUF115 domain-containing protein [bacterium]
MNNVFEKNLIALEQKNKKLAERLKNYLPNEVPQIVQENGSYNILYKRLYIHNKINPLGEAREIFSMAVNEPNSIHVIYGIGLGYLFQFSSQNSKGVVILYETDLNLMWLAFTLVDFSNEILKKNIYLTDSYDDMADAIYQKSGVKNTPQLLVLPAYRELNQQDFSALVQNLQKTVGEFAMDLQFTKEKFYPALQMMIQNIPNLLKELPLALFKDLYKSKTAVVVSAGPTLDRNIETLKKHRDKYVLFTVGTALKTLYANNLTPDFLCIIETFDSSRQVEELDLSCVNFITEPYSNPAIRRFKYKNTYSHISANMPINHFLADVFGFDISEYWSKGTVSHTALNSARLLGFSKIVLVGQDLSYVEGQCYSKDSAYKDLICNYNKESEKWEITAKDMDSFANAISPSSDYNTRLADAKFRLDRLNKSLYYVKGINGDMIPTEVVYASFVKPLSEYAKHFNDRIYINTSLVGAQIDGFKNMPLEDALKDSEEVGNISLNTDFKYDKENIKKELKLNLTELNKSAEYIDTALGYIKNLRNILRHSSEINADALKCLKKISQNYLYLSGEFSTKSKLFDFMMAEDKINLDYEMKMVTEFNYNNVQRICNSSFDYYNNAKIKLANISNLLGDVLNESFNSES